jgi:hypothetical protein
MRGVNPAKQTAALVKSLAVKAALPALIVVALNRRLRIWIVGKMCLVMISSLILSQQKFKQN